MVNCPKCGEPLVKRIKSKYFCENESCPVIFVRCPHEPARMRVAFAALAREQTIGEIEETIVKSRSHVF
jgi:ribosomal protein L37AE/L43A